MKSRLSYFKMLALILGTVFISLFCAMFVIRASALLILNPNLTDYIDQRFLEAIPDPSRCTFTGTTPFPTRKDRVIYRDFPLLSQALETNKERPILMFGGSYSRDISTDGELRERNIFNLSLALATPSLYEAVVKYLDEEYQILSDDYTGGAVIIFSSSLIFRLESRMNETYSTFFPQYGVFSWTQKPSGEFVITAKPDTFSIAKTEVAATSWNFFLKRDLPALAQLNYSGNIPSSTNMAGLPICREEASMQEHYKDLSAYITEEYADFEMPNNSTKALERMVVLLHGHNIPVILVHFPVIDDIYASEYQKEYMNYMNDFAERYNITVYDWSNLLDDKYFRDWAHITENGHIILTEKFYEMLDQEGL